MKRQQFNNYWKMNKGAGTALESVTAQQQREVPVTLPHDAMILNARQKELPYGNCVGYFPYETVHYTKTFQCRFYHYLQGVA